jgi:hypothetical protein
MICPDCQWDIGLHFSSDGAPLGCPAISRALGTREQLLRVCVRIGHGKNYQRKDTAEDSARWSMRAGHVLVTMPDCREGDQVLVWDLDTSEQWWGDAKMHFRRTTRATTEQRLNAQEEIEHRLGQKTRLVLSCFTKAER